MWISRVHPQDREGRKPHSSQLATHNPCTRTSTESSVPTPARYAGCAPGVAFFTTPQERQCAAGGWSLTIRIAKRLRLSYGMRTSARTYSWQPWHMSCAIPWLRSEMPPRCQSLICTEMSQWAQTVIQRQVKHMAWLLDDLLDVARITQGKLELKKQRITLNMVVDSAIEASRPLLDSKSHQFTVTLPAEHVYLDADPVRLSWRPGKPAHECRQVHRCGWKNQSGWA